MFFSNKYASLKWSAILFFGLLGSCFNREVESTSNIRRHISKESEQYLLEKTNEFLQGQLKEEVDLTHINYDRRYAYFENRDTVDYWKGKYKHAFRVTSHLTFSYFYQLQDYQLLQIKVPVNQFGVIDSLDERLQYSLSLINQIERAGWDEQFSQVIEIARDSFDLSGELYCNISTKEGLWWHIAERKQFRSKLGKYRRGAIFQMQDIEESKAIDIAVTKYY